MSATDAHLKDVCDYIASKGNTIKLHSADPGTTGANAVATTPASANTTWGAAAMDSGSAVASGSAVTFTIPASTTASHYGIYNGSTFLRGFALDAGITVNSSGAVSVDVTPKIKHTAS